MLKLSLFALAILALQCQLLAAVAEPAAPVQTVQVTLDLADGSRLIGTPEVTALALRADFGKVSIALPSISSIKFTVDGESVVVEMRNHDKLTGFLERPTLPLATLFGEVSVPLEHVREMRFALPAPTELAGEVGHSMENGNQRLVLQPGPTTGQNVFVDKLSDRPSANHNHNAPELVVNAWTVQGVPVVTRTFIKFKELAQIPATAKVISAKLYLFGVSSSLVGPQGNSYYPGSPYYNSGENRCVVERVIGNDWDPATLTYDNQPASTTEDQALVPASTSQWQSDAVVDVRRLVQDMVAHPSQNFGWVIKLQHEEKYRSLVFASSEARNAAVRPKLVIVYH